MRMRARCVTSVAEVGERREGIIPLHAPLHASCVVRLCSAGQPRRFHEGTPYCTEACLKKHVETRRVAKDALE